METSLAIDLARFQFGFTIAFHIIFPAFTIGLASYLAVLEGLWLYTGRQVYHDAFKYCVKIFAVAFGMGVVSGIVLSYQLGTNWSVFSDKVGPVLGPLLGYEILSAFFLEAGFLGIMLFGMEKVGKKLHFTATCLVALGTCLSGFFILSANSWMQTPAGYAINEAGQFIPKDWFEIVFNPSFPYRFVHMMLAAYLTTAFVIGAVAAYHLLRDKKNEVARLMFSMAMWMAIIVSPIQIIAGDMHGLNTLKYQPAKIAAIEGHFETHKGQTPLILFGIPDMKAERTHLAIEIPFLGSLILTHTWNGEIKGLKSWPKSERPNSTVIFFTFRIMVAIGFLMLLVGMASLWLRYRNKLYDVPLMLKASIVMGPSGFIAVLCGWITTEMGRQPYTVYGLLRTVDSASPIALPAIATSLVAFILVYFTLFGVGTYYILRLMGKTPVEGDKSNASDYPTRAAGIVPGPAMPPPRQTAE